MNEQETQDTYVKQPKQAKMQITQADFNKRVEFEYAHLTYMDRMPKEMAEGKAYDTIAKKYEVMKGR